MMFLRREFELALLIDYFFFFLPTTVNVTQEVTISGWSL